MKNLLFCLLLVGATFTVFSQNNRNLDSDGDGVIDRIDLDDDNDGILDSVEDDNRNESLTAWKNRINVIASLNNVIFRSGAIGWNNTINTKNFSELGFTNNYEVTFNVRGSKKAIIGFGVEESSYSYEDVDYGFMFKNNEYEIYGNGVSQSELIKFQKRDLFAIRYKQGKLMFLQNDVLIKTFDVETGMDFYLDTSFEGYALGNGNWNRFRNRNGNGNGNGNPGGNRVSIFTGFKIASVGNSDVDNDGILNSLDSDADGDGCNDVVEAGFTDSDEDGILGEGTPRVDNRGRVLGNGGYTDVTGDYLDPNVKICVDDEEDYGITINTKNLPVSIYDIKEGDNVIEGLESGNLNSEYFLNLGENDGVDRIVLLDVRPTSQSSGLTLRFKVNGLQISEVQVLTKDTWLDLASEFYTTVEGGISFKSESTTPNVPFTMNLINGVQYDFSQPLTLKVEDNIDLTGATLEIIAPSGATIVVQPSNEISGFVLDSNLNQSGSYQFIARIQGKAFKGHFLVVINAVEPIGIGGEGLESEDGSEF